MRKAIGIRRVMFFLLAGALGATLAETQDWTAHNQGKPRAPARYRHAIAYDSARQCVVLFGGVDLYAGYFADTWEWDGSAWTQRNPAVHPSPRANHAMAYDSARQRVLLFGGYDTTSLRNDTWEWDGNNWTQRTPAVSPPPAGTHCMAYDAARQRTVYFGCAAAVCPATWEWDGSTWRQCQPTRQPPGTGAMVYDAARRRVVHFGGIGSSSGWSDDTWEWDGTNWTLRQPAHKPGGRHSHAMAYDSARQRIVLFAGDSNGWWQNDTWEWDGTNWNFCRPATSPAIRANHAMAYDSSRQRVVLFGGQNLGSMGMNDTWEYGFPGTVAVSGTARPGATVSLVLTAATDAGLPYQAGSSLGTGPIVVDIRQIGLSPDALLEVSVGNRWPWVFQGYRGVLNGRGQAPAAIKIPNHAALVGARFHTAFLTMDRPAPSGIRSISTTVTITITT